MSLSDFARQKAIQYIEDAIRQADPSVNLSPSSPLRSLMTIPGSFVYSSTAQEIEELRQLYLGNFDNISAANMDRLAGNLLQERPPATPATTSVRVYVSSVQPFELNSFPYFSTAEGVEFLPSNPRAYNVGDFLEEDGEFYVSVPVISTEISQDNVIGAGEINRFTNFPIPVRYVTNPTPSRGGARIESNAEFFNYLQTTFNDRTPNQIGGVEEYILDNFSSVEDVLVARAGNPLVVRDEIWTTDGVNPNLDREGRPFAAHIDLGTVLFDTVYSRVFSALGVFTEDLVGKRIAIEGDIEKFRKVLRYVTPQQIVVSGPPLSGSATAEIWGDGPKVKVMADIYAYIPEVEVQSVVVDKRFFLVSDQSTTGTRVYYTIAPGLSYGALPDSGKLVVSEGASEEQIFDVASIGVDPNGAYLQLTTNATVDADTPLSYYDTSPIKVGQDITATPVLFVLAVETLDPLSFELEGEVPRTLPGNYDEPGYYISNTDPAEVFSAREQKEIVLDTKEGVAAFAAIEDVGNIIDSASYFVGSTETNGTNTFKTAVQNWTGLEGREITISRPAFELTADSVSRASILSGAGTNTVIVDGLDVDWMSNFGGRDDCLVLTYNSGSAVGIYQPGECLVYGNRVSLKAGSFSGSINEVTVRVPDINNTEPASGSPNEYAWNEGVFKQWDNISSSWIVKSVDTTPLIDALEIETVVLEVLGDPTEIVITALDPIDVRMSITDPSSATDTSEVADVPSNVLAESLEGNFTYRPVRVTYATHSDYQVMQSNLDDGDFGLTVKDDLVRSFYPTILDIPELRYVGVSTPAEVTNRFLDIVQNAVEATSDNQSVRLDISNIIGQLDEEGFSDSIDVDIEIRVTNFLDDGETEVRYINPSERTVQEMAIHTPVSPGDSTITLIRTKTTENIPGRGKLFLGGNNPATQEIMPYEAVIENADGTLTLILRAGLSAQYAHPQWETASVSVRDYEPELEFKRGAIIIPANNRPYVRELNIIKEST